MYMEKVVIAGSGPAGLTAALYTARANLDPLVLLGPVPGGQLVVSYEVENYPGFVDPISGAELMDRFRDQAARFGARLQHEAVVRATRRGDNRILVETGSGTIETETLVIATGAEARRLPIPSEPAFYGKGVSGCATCDGAFFRDQELLVVGGGNTAMEDAMFLTRFASKVTIVHRRDYFRAAQIEVEKCRRHAKIAWLVPWIVDEILGDNGGVTGALLRHAETGETREVACGGIFVAIGHDPKTEPFQGLVKMDEDGFIIAEAGSTRTAVPGVFACGDVRDPRYKQAVLAAGHGCMAALDVEQYLGQRE
jgi:thioredoxin reductase (NADPH)